MAERIDRRRMLGLTAVATGAFVVEQTTGGLFTARTAEAAPAALNVDGMIDASGFPDRAQDVLTTEVSLANFRNRYEAGKGRGANAYKAEPGVLLYSDKTPDQIAKVKAFAGNNYEEWFTNSVSQQVFENDNAQHRVGEARFSRYSLGKGTLVIPGVDGATMRLVLQGDEVTHYNVFVRGLSADGSTPHDRNKNVSLTDLVGGNVLAEQYPKGAYVSANYVESLRESAFAGIGNQNGAEGARRYYEIYADRKSGALNVLRFNAVNAEPTLVYSNYAN